MTRLLSVIVVLVQSCAVLVCFDILSSGPLNAEGYDSPPKPAYVGSRKCKMCHKKEAGGAQYKIWKESRHSKAFETLGTEKAAEFAKARSIEGSPQEAPDCLKCHVTAYGLSEEELVATKLTIEEGVSCESCHGPGSLYGKKKTMKRITAGELDPASVWLVKPDEKVCVGCHNDESPAYKEFDFDSFYKKIAHPRPESAKDTGD